MQSRLTFNKIVDFIHDFSLLSYRLLVFFVFVYTFFFFFYLASDTVVPEGSDNGQVSMLSPVETRSQIDD
jgi:hypothetical protein